MCICVNCRHINQCTTYSFIEKQHKINQHLSLEKIPFIPQNTIIKININNLINIQKIDWDLVECLSFVEQPGQWLNNPIT